MIVLIVSSLSSRPIGRLQSLSGRFTHHMQMDFTASSAQMFQLQLLQHWSPSDRSLALLG